MMNDKNLVTHGELDARLVLFYDSLNRVSDQCGTIAKSVESLAISAAEDRQILIAFADKQETRIDDFEKRLGKQDTKISSISSETKKNTETRIKRWAYLTGLSILVGPLVIASYKEMLGL